MLDIARKWTSADLCVVATNLKSKRPRGKWAGITHTVPALLEAWPEGTGIGLLTEPSGLVVVDLDVKSRDKQGNLVDGVSSWATLLQRLGLPNFAAQETTPSGGQHVYFYADDAYPIKTSVSKDQGIDVRGIGGFIVAAPTPGYVHTAGITAENFPDHIHVMPELLKQYFSKGDTAPGHTTPHKAARAQAFSENPEGAARQAVEKFRKGDGPHGELGQGNRNVALHFVACRLWELDAISPGIADEHYDEVVDILNNVPGDPMDADEILKTWQSARRNAEDAPLVTVLPVQDPMPSTDLGNAKRLRNYLDAKGTPAHFTPESGYLLWDGRRWHRDSLHVVRTAAQHVADELYHYALLEDERAKAAEDAGMLARAKGLKSWAHYTQSSNGLTAMLTQFQYLPGVSVSLADFDTSPELLNVRNGTVDLRTRELRPHSPADKLTKVITYDYAPEAPATRWRQFLTEVFTDPDMPDYYQRLIGYGITGENSEQCLAICHSTGSSGKSVAADTLAHVFQEYTHISDFSTFEGSRTGGGASPELVALRGARLVFASEGTAGAPLAEATVKKLTGSEQITARDLYKSPVTFQPTALIILSTNHVPVIKGQDDGVWRRCKSIHWPVQFTRETRDPNLTKQLKGAEAEGILAWAIEGAHAWYLNGLIDPESVTKATASYRVSQDILSQFLPGVIIRDANSKVELKDAYAWYIAWASEIGLQPRDIVTRLTFQRLLDERKIPTVVGAGNKRYLQGVRKASKEDTVALVVA